MQPTRQGDRFWSHQFPRGAGSVATAIGSVLLLSACVCSRPQIPVNTRPVNDITAQQWAREATRNELKVLDYGHPYLRYQIHSKDAKGERVRETIQSKDGLVARLVARVGRPLTAEEDAGEQQRLQAMLESPEAFAKHVKGEANGRRTAADLIRMIPDALIFSYTPGQPRREPHGDAAEIVLDFKSNPRWSPPNMTAEALTGLEGRVWIDAQTHSMTRLEGNIVRGVSFGWFVAHVYPGGHFLFEQTRLGDQRWMVSRFEYQVEVRLLVKRMNENAAMQGSDFAEVPEMSYQDAIRKLLAIPVANAKASQGR